MQSDDNDPGRSVVRPIGRVLYALGQLPLFPAEAIDHAPRTRQAPAAAITPAYGRYIAQSCTGCHGVTGKGDGPAAKALPVRPADHTDTKKMSQYSDEHLFTVISKGGARVGKSAQMPAWGAVLKEPQIHEIMTYIRTLSMTE